MKNLLEALIIVISVWGLSELANYLWVDDEIHSTEQIVPEIELVVKDSLVDTIYVYKMPY